MQFNIKWNSYNDFLVTIWSFKIIVQISSYGKSIVSPLGDQMVTVC